MLIVDDHQVVRQGLRTFLELHDDIVVVGEAGDGAGRCARWWRASARCCADGPHDAAAGRYQRHQADHARWASTPG